jgi:hypothetical protein
VFFQHHDEQLRFDDRTGEEKFHARILATDSHRWNTDHGIKIRLVAMPVCTSAFCKP